MHEKTGRCPYINHCRDIQTRRRVEAKLIQERRDLYSRYTDVNHVDYNGAMEEYRKNLDNIKRAIERCHDSHRRCLRFWQLRRREEEEAYMQPIIESAPKTITSMTQ